MGPPAGSRNAKKQKKERGSGRMNEQLIICIVIFAVTLLSYILNRIPMWVTSLLSLAALYVTGCIDSAGALSGFSNTNTILMGTMFVVAAGFRRTSMVDTMCKGLMKMTRGSFRMAYLGYLILAAILTNFIASPMVVYAIVSPLLAALCDNTGTSRSKMMFPMMVVCVSCCGILPLPTAIQMAGQFSGFLETYGFDMVFQPVNFLIGAWPVPVSYTHLDVYKRQVPDGPCQCSRCSATGTLYPGDTQYQLSVQRDAVPEDPYGDCHR